MRFVLLLVPLVGCASVQKSEVQVVQDDVAHGRFADAVVRAARLAEEHPDEPRYAELHRDTSVAWLLDRGRELTFQERDLEALGEFHRALDLNPDSREARIWIDKTTHKLARVWLERGLELHASGKLQEAVEAYHKSLEYVPRDPSALNGLGEAIIQVNYREGMGEEYFEEGLEALSEYWLEQARSRFSYAEKYQPEDAKTQQRQSQVDALLAQQRLAVARSIEESGRYGAAKNEYRLAMALDPESEEARAGFERCSKEAKATDLLSKARMEIVRGRTDHALDLIAQGEVLTEAQRDLFEGARAQVEQHGFEELYEEALTLERDLQYEHAVDKYAELLGQAEYYKDALARKETLEQYIRLAKELYAKAQAAKTDQERIEELRKISVFWPEYLDVAEQLAKLSQEP